MSRESRRQKAPERKGEAWCYSRVQDFCPNLLYPILEPLTISLDTALLVVSLVELQTAIRISHFASVP